MRNLIVAILLAAAASACALPPPTLPPLTQTGIQERTGHGVRPLDQRPDAALPAGVNLNDGVTEDEAVSAALWNNAQLAADLAGLGVARANLIDAGQFRNPTLQTLFPIGAKPFELTLSLPIEQFLLRPSRVKAARAQWEVAAESLIQNGLNMARDARLGHASLVQAQARSATAREAAEVRAAIGRITDARLRAGDISASESKSAAADAEAAADAARQAQHDVIIAQDRLRVLLGLAPGIALEAQATAVDTQVPPPVDDLRTRAWSERPDLRAAELSVAAAAARAKWERSRLLTLGGVLSTKDVGSSGVRSGPGVSLDLPIFRSNAGPVSRADAEVEQAARQYIALRQRVDFEVSEARESLVRALDSLASWRDRVLPALRDVTADTRRAYEAGNVPYLTVLEFTRQSVDAALREIDLQAAARKAAADLDRSVGVRVARGK